MQAAKYLGVAPWELEDPERFAWLQWGLEFAQLDKRLEEDANRK